MPAHIKAEGKACCDDNSTSTLGGSARKDTTHTPAGPLVQAVPQAWPGGPSRPSHKSSFAVGREKQSVSRGCGIGRCIFLPPCVWRPYRVECANVSHVVFLSSINYNFTATDMPGTEQARTKLSLMYNGIAAATATKTCWVPNTRTPIPTPNCPQCSTAAHPAQSRPLPSRSTR